MVAFLPSDLIEITATTRDLFVQYWPVTVTVALCLAGAVLYTNPPMRHSTLQFLEEYGIFLVFGTFAALGIYLFLTQGPEFFDRMFARHGLTIIFFIFILEGAMLLYFAPSESLVPGAILLSSRQGGSIPEFAAIIGIAVVGATIGQYLLFRVAKRGGREYLLEKRWFRVSDEKLDKLEGWFDKWGPVVIPISNTLLFTRGMLTVPAGFAKMNDRTFIVLSAIGTLSFQIVLAALAFGILEFL